MKRERKKNTQTHFVKFPLDIRMRYAFWIRNTHIHNFPSHGYKLSLFICLRVQGDFCSKIILIHKKRIMHSKSRVYFSRNKKTVSDPVFSARQPSQSVRIKKVLFF